MRICNNFDIKNNYNNKPTFKNLDIKTDQHSQTLKEGKTIAPKFQIPSFVALKIQDDEQFFTTFLNKKGRVTKKEYDEIIKKHPSTIIKAQKFVENQTVTLSSPKQIAKAALKLKEKYDNEYNQDYIIASIGTSPAPITEVMSALGCKVIFIPASGLNSIAINRHYIFRKQYPTVASRIANVNHIVKYAKKNGLNQKRNDYLILLDYCYTGTGLTNLCDIFCEEGVFTPNKMHDRSILNDLSESSNLRDKNSIFRLEDLANISHDMQHSNFEHICNVPHFYVYDDDKKATERSISSDGKKRRGLFKEFDSYSLPLARAFSLCAIHEAINYKT